MKSFFIIITLIASGLVLYAQPPQGRRPGGRPHRGEMKERPAHREGKVGVMKLPEIPGLTDNQREKLVSCLTDERKNVMSLMSEKHEMQFQLENKQDLSQKEIEKQKTKIAKIDEKIEKKKNKSDKKINSILTAEQYMIYSEKKKEIEFSGREKRMNRPPHRENKQHSENFDEGIPPYMQQENEF